MEPDIRKHVKAATILRVVAAIGVVWLLMVLQCFAYDAKVLRTKEELRSLGEKFVYGRMTPENVSEELVSSSLEKVSEEEYATDRRVDHWLNFFDHEVHLLIRFEDNRAVQFRVYDSARAL